MASAVASTKWFFFLNLAYFFGLFYFILFFLVTVIIKWCKFFDALENDHGAILRNSHWKMSVGLGAGRTLGLEVEEMLESLGSQKRQGYDQKVCTNGSLNPRWKKQKKQISTVLYYRETRGPGRGKRSFRRRPSTKSIMVLLWEEGMAIIFC